MESKELPSAPRRIFSRRAAVTNASCRGAALVGVGLALGGVCLGAPAVLAAWSAVGARGTLCDVWAGAPVPIGALAAAEQDLVQANQWTREGGRDADRGLLILHQAQAVPEGDTRQALLAKAEAATVAGLAAAPGQPGVWARLAYLRKARGDGHGAVAALRLSFLSGSFVPEIMVSRLQFALTLFPVMDSEMVALVRRQVRLTWVVAPDTVTALGARRDVGPMVQEALMELSEGDVSHYLQIHGHEFDEKKTPSRQTAP